MSRVVVVNHLTLDGVMQAPSGPDEDRRDGFGAGGWAVPYGDEVMARVMTEHMAAAEGGALLLGRWTYESFAAYWPHQTDNPFTPVLNARQKYVASNTLREPLPWENSTLLPGDATAAVTALKASRDGDLAVLGSGRLIQSLLRADLIDELLLTIHPIVLGAGQRLFPEGGAQARFTLTDSTTTTTGVIIATYQRVQTSTG
jgi:dihydrofolate reductase